MTTTTQDRKTAIVRAAARLFRRQGYAGTGVSEILTQAEAPRGSLYYYFPDGKEAIGAAAVAASGAAFEREMRAVAAEVDTGAQMVLRSAKALGDWLARSGFTEGCSIATTVLETAPASRRIREAGDTAYQSWITAFAEVMAADGHDETTARKLAILAITALQGGMILARAAESLEPLNTAAEAAADHIAAVRPDQAT